MADLLKHFRHLLFGDKGQGMVEYGLIIGLVSIVLLGTLILLGTSLDSYFTNIAAALPGAS